MKRSFLIALLIGMMGIAQSQEAEWNYGMEVNYIFAQPSTDFANRKIVLFRDTTTVEFNVDTLEFMGVKFTPIDLLKWKVSSTAYRDTLSTTFGIYSYNINHGQAYTPDHIFLQSRSQDAAADCWVSAITPTYFTITFINSPPTDSDNVIFDWVAYK